VSGLNLVVTNACIRRGDALVKTDIGIAAGRIAVLAPSLSADAPVIDAGGCLVVPGLVETHIHLDKTCILDRCTASEGSVAEAVREMPAAAARWRSAW
jgi:cytosine deaminase